MHARAYLNLLRVHEALTGEFDALFKAHGLSQPAYNVLRILRGAGEERLTCGQIAERMVSRVPDVTRLLDRLEKRGLASRARAERDRRVVEAGITPQGLALLGQLDEPVEKLHSTQFSALSEAELSSLDRALAKLLAAR